MLNLTYLRRWRGLLVIAIYVKDGLLFPAISEQLFHHHICFINQILLLTAFFLTNMPFLLSFFVFLLVSIATDGIIFFVWVVAFAGYLVSRLQSKGGKYLHRSSIYKDQSHIQGLKQNASFVKCVLANSKLSQ